MEEIWPYLSPDKFAMTVIYYLVMLLPQFWPPLPMGLNLGTYMTQCEQGFAPPQEISSIDQGNYDLMLLIKTKTSDPMQQSPHPGEHRGWLKLYHKNSCRGGLLSQCASTGQTW